MKKTLSLMVFAIVALLAVSCSSENSPSDTAAKALECIVQEDWEGLVDQMDYPDTEKGQEEKSSLIGFLKEKVGKGDGKDKMVSYKILGETIAEDKQSAVVDYESTTAGGKTEKKSMKLKKNEKGEWKLENSK